MNSRWLRLFGPIQVEESGSPVDGFRSLKALALLGYLAVEGRPVSRPALAGLFWGEAAEDQARRELRRVLHNLSARLPGCLRADRKIVQFEADASLSVDVLHFADLVDQGDLARAVNLYRGDFMEGLFLDDCPEFEAWLTVQRERQRQLLVEVLDSLVTQHQADGDFEQALIYAQRLLALDNWREETHRQVMLLLARTGQISAALRQYGRCRQILAEELAVAPSQQTVALYERLRALRSGDRRALPQPTSALIGRTAELSRISHLLTEPECRLLTLVGSGGAGKTRLAIQAGEDAATGGLFLEGVFFVGLAGLESIDFLASTIIDSLPFSLLGRTDPARQLLNYLEDKELLLILDNFEHLLPEGNELLKQILREAAAVKIVVTSRSRLNLEHERLFRVQGLTTTPRDDVDHAVSETAASRLFWRCAGRIRSEALPSESAPSAAEREQVDRICQLVEGLPLAIELSAAWMGALTPGEIVQEMAGNIDFLASPGESKAHRHQSLRVVFDHSWELLTTGEQAVFQSLSVFRAGFDRPAAEQVAGASPVVLRALLDKSFLQWDGAGRYDIHELLRQYGLEKLQEAGEDGLTRQYHASYFMELSEAAEPELFGGASQQARMKQFDHELNNVRAALNWSLAHDTETGLRLAAALGHFWHIRGHHIEGRRWLTQFLENAEVSNSFPDLYRAKALHQNGWLAFIQGFVDEYYDLTTESIDLWRSLSDQHRLPYALADAAVAVLFGRRDIKQAQELGHESIMLARRLEDDLGLAYGLFALAHISYVAQDYASAERYASNSRSLFKAAGDTGNLGGPVSTLGRIAFDQGDYGAAVAFLQESAQLFRDSGDKPGLAIALRVLGQVIIRLGDFDRAELILQEEAEIRRLMGDPTSEAYHLHRSAEIALGREQFPIARDHSLRAAALWQEYEELDDEKQAWAIHGQALEALGDTSGALSAYRQASQSSPVYAALLPALAGMARLSLVEGDSTAALAHVEDVLGRMATNPPNGKDDPFPAYLTCYRVLQVCDDGRAFDLLKIAHDQLQDRAATIKDQGLEKSFLSLPVQRDILAEASEARL